MPPKKRPQLQCVRESREIATINLLVAEDVYDPKCESKIYKVQAPEGLESTDKLILVRKIKFPGMEETKDSEEIRSVELFPGRNILVHSPGVGNMLGVEHLQHEHKREVCMVVNERAIEPHWTFQLLADATKDAVEKMTPKSFSRFADYIHCVEWPETLPTTSLEYEVHNAFVRVFVGSMPLKDDPKQPDFSKRKFWLVHVVQPSFMAKQLRNCLPQALVADVSMGAQLAPDPLKFLEAKLDDWFARNKELRVLDLQFMCGGWNVNASQKPSQPDTTSLPTMIFTEFLMRFLSAYESKAGIPPNLLKEMTTSTMLYMRALSVIRHAEKIRETQYKAFQAARTSSAALFPINYCKWLRDQLPDWIGSPFLSCPDDVVYALVRAIMVYDPNILLNHSDTDVKQTALEMKSSTTDSLTKSQIQELRTKLAQKYRTPDGKLEELIGGVLKPHEKPFDTHDMGTKTAITDSVLFSLCQTKKGQALKTEIALKPVTTLQIPEDAAKHLFKSDLKLDAKLDVMVPRSDGSTVLLKAVAIIIYEGKRTPVTSSAASSSSSSSDSKEIGHFSLAFLDKRTNCWYYYDSMRSGVVLRISTLDMVGGSRQALHIVYVCSKPTLEPVVPAAATAVAAATTPVAVAAAVTTEKKQVKDDSESKTVVLVDDDDELLIQKDPETDTKTAEEPYVMRTAHDKPAELANRRLAETSRHLSDGSMGPTATRISCGTILYKLIHFAVDDATEDDTPHLIARTILEKLNLVSLNILSKGFDVGTNNDRADKVAAEIVELLKVSPGVCKYCEKWSADIRSDGASRDWCTSAACEDTQKAVESESQQLTQAQPRDVVDESSEVAKLLRAVEANMEEKKLLDENREWASKPETVEKKPEIPLPDPSAFVASSSASSSTTTAAFDTPAPADSALAAPRVPGAPKRKREVTESPNSLLVVLGTPEAIADGISEGPVKKRLRLSDEDVKRIADQVAVRANIEQESSSMQMQLDEALARVHALEQFILGVFTPMSGPLNAFRDTLAPMLSSSSSKSPPKK